MVGKMLITMENLHNYRTLVAKVDALCRKVVTEFDEHLSCRPGCDGCCRHLSLFPVEGVALAMALQELPAVEVEHIRKLASDTTPNGHCPLLQKGLCLLYPARPIICRSHGLPVLVIQDGTKRIDYCPQNFRGVPDIPAGAVINLELLNTTLASINALFIASSAPASLPLGTRLTIAEALLIEL
jgi:Fe-S-cluster containining protein